MTTKKEKDPGEEILKLVEKLHEDRKIPRETILNGIASAIQVAAERHFGVEEGVSVTSTRPPATSPPGTARSNSTPKRSAESLPSPPSR